MKLPEPCLKSRCWSPVACNAFGYCRERNEGRPPIDPEVASRRKLAAARQAQEDKQR